MTALNISTDIPTGINTLEKLAAWVGLAMSRTNPTKEAREVPYADPERCVQSYLIKDEDGITRLVSRTSIAISEDYASGTAKFWTHALELSNTNIPPAFKTN